jgi:hypothetical protein
MFLRSLRFGVRRQRGRKHPPACNVSNDSLAIGGRIPYDRQTSGSEFRKCTLWGADRLGTNMNKVLLLFSISLAGMSAQSTSVLTYHYDTARTGLNNTETILTQQTVNANIFGKLFSYPVDGQMYAQPLYVHGVTINGQVHNVVFAVTENDSVYAFDADSNAGANANALWHSSFIQPPGVVTVPSDDIKPGYTDVAPQIGITGTPVIDNGKLFVVAATKETNGQVVTYVQRLHALDITTGLDTTGSPVVISPTFPGLCTSNDGNGHVTFGPLLQNQRAALLASNGVIYVGWGSHGDYRPFQGWLVAYNESSLQQVSVLNVDPDKSFYCNGGIWMAGSGPAVDAAGNIFLATGNGNFKPPAQGGNSYGDSWLRLTSALQPVDYFTPHNQDTLDKENKDVGSGGIIVLPDQPGPFPHLMTGAGKEGTIYLVNRNKMGRYNANGDIQIVQELPLALHSMFGVPVYFQNTVYFAATGDFIKAFQLTNGQFQATPVSQSANAYSYPGVGLSISSGPTGTGILWALDSQVAVQNSTSAILHAFKADNLKSALYSSNTFKTRDAPGPGVKFTVPVVVNGKVYVGGASSLSVFGLLPH